MFLLRLLLHQARFLIKRAISCRGLHQVTLKLYDLAGNMSESAWQFSVDTLPPVISGETPKDVVLTSGENVSISAQYRDDLSGISVANKLLMLDGIDVSAQTIFSGNGLSYQIQNLPEGQHEVFFQLKDT